MSSSAVIVSIHFFSFSKLTVYSSFGTDWDILTITLTAIKIVIHITVVPRGCGLLTLAIPRSTLSFHQQFPPPFFDFVWKMATITGWSGLIMPETQFLYFLLLQCYFWPKNYKTNDNTISLRYNLCLPNGRMLIWQTKMVGSFMSCWLYRIPSIWLDVGTKHLGLVRHVAGPLTTLHLLCIRTLLERTLA